MFVVKVPCVNGLGKTAGCRNAGNAVLKALYGIHSSEMGKPIDANLLDLEEIHMDNGNLKEANSLIYENALETYQKKDKVIFLGGDHSGSYSLVKAFFDWTKEEGKEPCLIVFDAHADCMEPMEEPTHEEWLRKLIESGFPVENILLVGVRNMWKTEIEFVAKNKIKKVALDFLNDNLQEATDFITEFADGKELYVSLDVDVVDPTFAPATGYPEPGGLSSRQIIYLVQRLSKIKSLKAFDLMEINLDKDGSEQTLKLGAKILGELI